MPLIRLGWRTANGDSAVRRAVRGRGRGDFRPARAGLPCATVVEPRHWKHGMKRRWKVLGGLGLVLLLGVGALAATLAHTTDCPPAPPSAGDSGMRAWVARCYGPPSVMSFETTPRPALADDRVLVRVHAAGANPLDWHTLRGEPRVMRLASGIGAPKDPRMGADFAGVVEAVGKDVTRFKPGDAVFGVAPGAFAEYVVAREARIAPKPAALDFAETAALPVAAVTALQALRDKGRLQAGQKVLINGASGGVGTFAVQIAKALGAEVTGVCSTRNVELVRSLGADRVIDYTREDFTTDATRYDLVIDLVGNHGVFALRDVLTPQGALVRVGSFDDEPFLGPVWGMLAIVAAQPLVEQRLESLLAEVTTADLEFLAGLADAGQLTVAIDRRYPLADAAAAITYLETARARGKVVIEVP
jgi:NADPH:quinone reductase-like Zn-dependent oxidoreductase